MPLVLVEVVPVVLPELVVEVRVSDSSVVADVRSISSPRPRITPANCIAAGLVVLPLLVVLVLNASVSDTLIEQSGFTLYVPVRVIAAPAVVDDEVASMLPAPSKTRMPLRAN